MTVRVLAVMIYLSPEIYESEFIILLFGAYIPAGKIELMVFLLKTW